MILETVVQVSGVTRDPFFKEGFRIWFKTLS